MLRLVKYLKPYTLLILVTIALLFVQANADLALPISIAETQLPALVTQLQCHVQNRS